MDSQSNPLLKQSLAQRLILLGYLGSAEVEDLARQEDLGTRFAERAYLSGLVTDEQLVAACLSLGARDCTRIMNREIPAEVSFMLPAAMVLAHRVVPFQCVGGHLHLAMLDPFDDQALEECAHLSGCVLDPWVARASVLFDVLCRTYGGTPPVPRVPERRSPRTIPPTYQAPSQTPAFSPVVTPAPVMFTPPRGRPTLPGIPLAPPRKLCIPIVQSSPQPLAPPPRQAPPPVRPTPAVVPAGDVLQSLVPPFHRAAWLVVDGEHAVVMEVAGATVPRQDYNGLRLSLQDPSTFREAAKTREPCFSDDCLVPVGVEHELWKRLDGVGTPPVCWTVWPLFPGTGRLVLLYLEGPDPRDDRKARAHLDAAIMGWGLDG